MIPTDMGDIEYRLLNSLRQITIEYVNMKN